MINRAKERIEEELKQKTGRLHLGFCKLDKIPEEIEKMTWLKVLSLDNNQISKIEGLNHLNSLTTLYLYNNQISKIEGLNHMNRMATLYITTKQIRKVE